MAVPLDLQAEVTTASGARYRWDANQAPGSRPQNLSFRTKLGEGFSDANLSLARRIDFDYPDLNLVDTVTLIGADGSIAYEGRVSAMPRDLNESHSVGVTLTGWMSHAKDRKFTEIYVDRDLSAWNPASVGRRLSQLSGNANPSDPSQTADPTNNEAGVTTGWSGGWVSPFTPISEAWYDAGPECLIGKVTANWRRSNTGISVADTNWHWHMLLADTDLTGSEVTVNFLAAGPGSALITASTPRRWAALQHYYAATPAGSDGVGYGIEWSKIVVYGDHGLSTAVGEPGEPAGVFASDVIRDIATRYCPKLDTSGVQNTTYVIQQLAFKDHTYPYDAFLEVNKFHLWHLGVWEDRRLDFRPYDLSDYDWEIRTDDPGTTFSPQGPSVDSLFNGIQVTYTDLLTGREETLSPNTTPTLREASLDNPWNKQGINHWDEIKLSSPTLAASAVQIGRTALVESNRPKAPGTITVAGSVRDRAGHEQPAWKVRAGDTISVTNFPNDTPRLIHETDYNDSAKTVTISVEAPASSLDAILDRQSVALGARGRAS